MLLIYGQSGYQTLTQDADSDLIGELVSPPDPIIVVGTTGVSVTMTAMGDLTGVGVGAVVTGTDIVNSPPTTVVALDNSAHTVTLSQAATGVNVGGNYTFQNVADGPYVGAIVMLYTNIITLPQKNPSVASLGEATYTGYARSSAIAWGAQLVAPDLSVFVSGDKKQFMATGSLVTNVVQGAAILASDGTTVLQVCPFPNPVSFADVGQGVDFVPVVSMTPQT